MPRIGVGPTQTANVILGRAGLASDAAERRSRERAARNRLILDSLGLAADTGISIGGLVQKGREAERERDFGREIEGVRAQTRVATERERSRSAKETALINRDTDLRDREADLFMRPVRAAMAGESFSDSIAPEDTKRLFGMLQGSTQTGNDVDLADVNEARLRAILAKEILSSQGATGGFPTLLGRVNEDPDLALRFLQGLRARQLSPSEAFLQAIPNEEEFQARFLQPASEAALQAKEEARLRRESSATDPQNPLGIFSQLQQHLSENRGIRDAQSELDRRLQQLRVLSALQQRAPDLITDEMLLEALGEER